MSAKKDTQTTERIACALERIADALEQILELIPKPEEKENHDNN